MKNTIINDKNQQTVSMQRKEGWLAGGCTKEKLGSKGMGYRQDEDHYEK